MIAAFLLFMGVLMIMKLAPAFRAEKRIEGIEDAAIRFEDLEIPEDALVVGIGEASHGNCEFQTVKQEVFEKLVKNNGAHAICFEMTAGEAAVYNEAVHEETGDLSQLIADTDYPLYDTQQIVDLLSWMRDYNRSVPYEQSLMIYGIDMQGAERSIAYLKDYAERFPEAFTEEEIRELSEIGDVADGEKESTCRFFEAMEKRLAGREDINSALLRVHVQVILQAVNAPSFEESQGDYADYRDNSMAVNLKSYFEIEERRGYRQILVTAHNGHVMKGASSIYNGEDNLTMGERINRLFEGSYYCIGTEYYRATVNIHTAGTYDEAYERADHDFCSDDVLAYQAGFFVGGRYCLDFSKITDESSKLYQTIHSRIYTGMVGEGFSLLGEAAGRSDRVRLVPVDRYNAMIYYFQASPIDPIHY